LSLPYDSIISATTRNITDGFKDYGKQLSEGSLSEFKSKAYFLYQKLLELPLKNLDKSINHLTIIPPEQLSTIPWELIIQNKDGSDYTELNYLLKDYSISYAYSANLLFNRQNKISETKGVLAFAPSYQGNTDQYQNIRSVFRDELVPLNWNEPEANAVSELFGGVVFKGQEATESAFKQQIGNHQVIHMAMHAFVDHQSAMQSKFVFTQTKDSIEDGFLHIYELFNMNIPAQMAVLSACNTGIGKIEEGEGVMSLARAFSYAGVPSTVLSHWEVDDESTSLLMKSFYQYLSDGKSKSESLRQAKLDFIAQSSINTQHPFYWASFVVIGDDTPFKNNKIPLIYIILGVILILAITFLIFRNKRKISS